MRYRPSRGLILCLVPLLATATAGAWAWRKANDVPLHERAKGDFVDLVSHKESLSSYDSAEWAGVVKEHQEETAVLKQKLLDEFPGLAIEAKPAPESSNGFLALHKFSGFPMGNGPRVGPKLRRLLDTKTEWNAEEVKAALDENPVEVARAEEIATMPDRSSSGMPSDYNGFISARAGKFCADVLLLKARLAAEAKDEAEALRLVSATRNLARHYREIEQPCLLAETVAILLDLSVTECVFHELLPQFGPQADLAKWKQALVTRGYTPADFAQVMRGEWNVIAEYYLIPNVLKQAPADGEKLLKIHAGNYEALVKTLPTMTWQEFVHQPCEPLGEGFNFLSAESRGIAGELSVGCNAWTKGYVRAASKLATHQAALDLMLLEKAGETLDPTTVEKIVVEPVSGQRFAYEPTSRTLSPPEGMKELQEEAVKLPW